MYSMPSAAICDTHDASGIRIHAGRCRRDHIPWSSKCRSRISHSCKRPEDCRTYSLCTVFQFSSGFQHFFRVDPFGRVTYTAADFRRDHCRCISMCGNKRKRKNRRLLNKTELLQKVQKLFFFMIYTFSKTTHVTPKESSFVVMSILPLASTVLNLTSGWHICERTVSSSRVRYSG